MIGIDPGVNNCGIAVFDVLYNGNVIQSVDAFTLVNSKLVDKTQLYEDLYSDHTVKFHKLMRSISEIISVVKPELVACETPFYSSFRPKAYASLLEVYNGIHAVIIDHNNNTPFIGVEPLLVKKTIGAGMTTGKLDVKEAVRRNTEIMSALTNDLDKLDEHSIDSMAVGYTALKLSTIRG
jgi:Holliday junction resolvasome RuvABC endonuclease subunit